MPVELTIDGKTFRTDELTLDEAAQIEKDAGTSWLSINPFQSANQCRAIIVAFLTRDVGREAAQAQAGAMTLTETLDALKAVGDDMPGEFEDGVPDPKAEAEPETPG